MAKSKLSILTLLGSTLALAAANTPKVMHMKTTREPLSEIEKRDTTSATISNVGSNYVVNASVGTPPQQLQFFLDTGSGDVWMIAPGACPSDATCPDAIFDPSQSSTFNTTVPGGFQIGYVDGTGANGDLVTDNLGIGNVTMTNLTMGLATNDTGNTMGVMGLSPGDSMMIDAMYNQSLIGSRSFSIWMDGIETPTGNILFGGYDSAKFGGDLTLLDLQPDSNGQISAYNVPWTWFSISDSNGTTQLTGNDFQEPALLDTGTTVTTIPYDLYMQLGNYFGGWLGNTSYGNLLRCPDPSTTIDYGFGGAGGPLISVPVSQLFSVVTDDDGAVTFSDGTPACTIGIGTSGPDGGNIFGDTFMRSAYFVYDMDKNVLGLAPTVFNSTSSNIIEINADSSGNDNLIATAPAFTNITITSPTANPTPPPGTATLTVSGTMLSTAPVSGQVSGFKTSIVRQTFAASSTAVASASASASASGSAAVSSSAATTSC